MDFTSLQRKLDGYADPKVKTWWENYLKHVIPFRGVKMADIRSALHQWVEEEGVARLTAAEQKAAALALIRLEYCEDKLAGILFLQERLLPANAILWPEDVPLFGALFQEGYIYDWNTCDWFCVRVLGPLATQQGPLCAQALADWRTAEPLWQRRAAAVAFVNLAKHGDINFPGFTTLVLSACAPLVASSERFAQTGAGWVLRELSLSDPDRIAGFIEARLSQFSTEGFSYATAKLPTATKSRLKALRTHPKP